jgi:molybdenum cofactor guanylyltransferase
VKKDILGLVVCGGHSSRMGQDKGLLNYHGRPQRYYLYHLLKEICNEVFISCNKQQANEIPTEYKTIIDREEFEDRGPLTALLSAHKVFPSMSLLVLGCDYPLVEKKDLEVLLQQSKGVSVIYKNNETGFIEPLIALYSVFSLNELSLNHSKFNGSLRRFLQKSDAIIIDHQEPARLKSVDTMEDYKAIIKEIN